MMPTKRLCLLTMLSLAIFAVSGLGQQTPDPQQPSLADRLNIKLLTFVRAEVVDASVDSIIAEIARISHMQLTLAEPIDKTVCFRFYRAPVEDALASLALTFGYEMVRQPDGRWQITRLPATETQEPTAQAEQNKIVSLRVCNRPLAEVVNQLSELTKIKIECPETIGNRPVTANLLGQSWWRMWDNLLRQVHAQAYEMEDGSLDIREWQGGEQPVENNEPQVSMEFQDAACQDVLLQIATIANENLVMPAAMSEKVSLRMRNLPWLKAFNVIARTCGWDVMQYNNSVFLLLPRRNPTLIALTGSWKEASLPDVLRQLAAASKRQLALPPQLEGKVTVALANVSWWQAVDKVMNASPWPEYLLLDAGSTPAALSFFTPKPTPAPDNKPVYVNLQGAIWQDIVFCVASVGKLHFVCRDNSGKRITVRGHYHYQDLLQEVSQYQCNMSEDNGVLVLCKPDHNIVVTSEAEMPVATPTTWQQVAVAGQQALPLDIQGVFCVPACPEDSYVFIADRRYKKDDRITDGPRGNDWFVHEILPDKVSFRQQDTVITWVAADK